MSLPKRALVFGVFDGLHEGHKYFLSQAKARCEKLLVVLTQNTVVERFKKKHPKHEFEERFETLRSYDPDLTILQGDPEPGSWVILENAKPDIVFLGHDQEALAEELKKHHLPFEYIDALEPERYKSSILNT